MFIIITKMLDNTVICIMTANTCDNCTITALHTVKNLVDIQFATNLQ